MKKIIYILDHAGFNPKKTLVFFRNLPWYINSLNTFRRRTNKEFPIRTLYPCLSDKNDSSGNAKGHYFHQDLYVSQKIFENKPKKHVDVGSRIDGFVAHVASFREIEVFDIRNISSKVKNIVFTQTDFMNPSNSHKEYADSVSSLHTIEHFGLGRYGDTIDSEGHIKGLNNICSILKPDGIFYLSIPISNIQRVEFNAHRVFSLRYIQNILSSMFEFIEFSYIDDSGDLYIDQDIQKVMNKEIQYGCGIFILRKI
jgi:SAM-dependent methyltransferase